MKSITAFLFIISTLFLAAQENFSFSKLSGEFFGQKKPGFSPQIFAPGIISTGFNERDIAISPDGKEIFYGFLTGKNITIMYTQIENGYWTEPVVASFASDGNFFYLEPCFSPDGNQVIFLSTKPPTGKEAKPKWAYQNLWASNKNENGKWGEPFNPDTVFINNGNQQYYPSFTKSGTMYFTRNDIKTKRSMVCRSRLINGKFSEAEMLPQIVNQEANTIYNAFISPAEDYLLACIDNKTSDINPGCANYYVFFRDTSGQWSDAVSFGPEINIKGSNAISASVSPDGKYLFFAAQKLSDSNRELLEMKNLGSMLKLLYSPQNGNYDLYWVDAGVIENLRPK